MKKLLAAYKNLPPELKMALTLLGLGTPVGLIYLIQRFTGLSYLRVVVLFAITVIALTVVGYLISKLFSFRSQKRQRQMSRELADPGALGRGPVSMDVAASIKANNEKFFNAVRDMRKNLGINVYDLPWYIVIGDSGCGKTKLINEGGLTFSAGKPEGYQLGTLNYNWWFTEDAVFIDMAGRLCNPRDDADFREWQAFLSTISKGRKGYPINGALVCVSAEHLLQDSPEKIEQDANTGLERLRDLQNKLGVTFATYVVVTKCDKILGFMQFFDRAERDIRVKNQIFGWSKPGDFNELYDPEQFEQDFEGLYSRLNELRLRRLNDDADEVELGLAYSFPEEFQELLTPLQVYVRTVFPPMRNPRAIKNLILRGVYFTSATQEGELILKHLTERLGAQAADQFSPLDLYPHKRPFFIKELLFRKVFPEHGLVFRNEQQVHRNRRLARLVQGATAALAVALAVLLVLSYRSFSWQILQPRNDAVARADSEKLDATAALERSGKLTNHIDALHRSSWARTVLSLGVGADRPVRDLGEIRTGVFEEGVLQRVLHDVDDALRSTRLDDPRKGAAVRAQADAYMKALEEYLVWLSYSGENSAPAAIGGEGFERLVAVVHDPKSFVQSQRAALLAEAKRYFENVRGGEPRNPARLLRTGFEPDHAEQTIETALRTVHDHLSGYAKLTDDHPNPKVAHWIEIRNRCDAIETAYKAILELPQRSIATQEDLAQLTGDFGKHFGSLKTSAAGLAWPKESGGGPYLRIPLLRDAVLEERGRWIDYQTRLEKARTAGGATATKPRVATAIAALSGGDVSLGMQGLDPVLSKELKALRLTEKDYFKGFFGEGFAALVKEINDQYAHIISVDRPADEFKDHQLQRAPALDVVSGVLTKVETQLAGTQLGPAADVSAETAEGWNRDLDHYLYESAAIDLTADEQKQVEKLAANWRPSELATAYKTFQDLIRRGGGTRLLATIEARLAQMGAWGFGELAAKWYDAEPSTFNIERPTGAGISLPARRDERDTRPPAPAPAGPKKRPPIMGGKTPTTPKPTVTPAPAVSSGAKVPLCATQEFLNRRAAECVELLYLLNQFEPTFYFRQASESQPRHVQCAQQVAAAWVLYADAYAQAWGHAYDAKHLPTLEASAGRRDGWSIVAEQFKPGGRPGALDLRHEIANEFRPALEELLKHTRFALFDPENGWWLDTRDDYEAQRKQVAAAFAAARDKYWKTSAFALYPVAPRDSAAANDPPWKTTADLFDKVWGELCTGMATNATIPPRYNLAGRENVKFSAIPWGRLAAARQDLRLGDEKLTAQLVAFEDQAQALLSAELTNILAGIQEAHFQTQAVRDGWPYLAAGDLETVEFGAFQRFLKEIEQARKSLAPLEDGLPAALPGHRARLAFYDACDKWHDFVFARSDQAKDLTVILSGDDPIDASAPANADTPQHYYEYACLRLGLVGDLTETREAVSDPQCVPTEREKYQNQKRRTVWRWPRGDVSNEGVRVALGGGLPVNERPSERFPEYDEAVGRASELALPAYLHRFGSGAGRNWSTVHRFALKDIFTTRGRADLASVVDRRVKNLLLVKFVFTLDRELPEPIRPIARVQPAAAMRDGSGTQR